MEGLKNLFQQETLKLGVVLNPAQTEKFFLYLQELKNWNKRFNLTGITGTEEILVKHFLDSLFLIIPAQKYNLPINEVLDLGSGAGFPGIPLKIVLPHLKLTLLEGNKKKVSFLEHLTRVLKLKETRAFWKRAEELAQDGFFQEKYDLTVSRAVTDLKNLVKLSFPFLKKEGFMVAYKGWNIEQEVKQAEESVIKRGGTIFKVDKGEISSVFSDQPLRRSLVMIKKTANSR